MERGDFSHFLGLYGPDKLPAGRRLREMMNGLVFGIEGWDDDPREIHAIPEIRRYYRPTESEFKKLWKDCVFAFDANTLLNVYRYKIGRAHV